MLAAAGIVLTACGTTEDATPDTGGEPAVTAAASDEPAAVPAASDDAETPVETNAPVDADPPAESEAPVGSDAAADPVEEALAASEPAAPAVPEAMLGGRAFAPELATESDFSENVLPDIQVDDIRREMKANLRNVFPAERPVLFWMWAPH